MENTIQSDLIRGHINTIILKALFDGDRYGYDIVREIEQKSSGQYKLKQPTLYSCLKRLEIQGFIRSYWGAKSNGGRRKYFTLTDMGRELFIKNQTEWEYSRTVIDKLISDREVDLNAARPLYQDKEDEDTVAYDAYSENDDSEDANENTENIVEEETAGENAEGAFTVAPVEDTPASQNITFSDTTAIMDELFRRQTETEQDSSYADKLISEKYVSDRTDSGISSEGYFRDFFNADEAFGGTNEQDRYSERPEMPQQTEQAEQHNSEEYDIYTQKQVNENKTDNIFLDYHTATVVQPNGNAIIEREYRNILGDFLNQSFVERKPDVSPVATDEQRVNYENVQNQYTDNISTSYTEADDRQAESENEDEYDTSYDDNSYDSENNYEEEQFAAYTNDADVNRKLNDLTGKVREMGDNVVIRTHNNAGSKQYNNAYYYYSNKLMIVHYGILFGIMMLEILFSAVFVNLVLGKGRSTDKWFYIVAVLTAVVFPVIAFIKNFTAPNKRKRINFSLKNSLIYRLIVTAQCFLIIYCMNVIGGMPLGFSMDFVTTLLMPALLCTGFPVSALVFNALFKSKKFAAEQ